MDFFGDPARFNRRVSTPSTPPSHPSVEGPVAFALAPALRARLLGTGLVAIGTIVLIAMLLTWLADLPTAVVTGLVVLAVVGVVALGLLVGVRHWVLRLDEHGYRVRGIRTAEARSARWTDVLDLQATTVCRPAVRRTPPARRPYDDAAGRRDRGRFREAGRRPSPSISTVDTGTAG